MIEAKIAYSPDGFDARTIAALLTKDLSATVRVRTPEGDQPVTVMLQTQERGETVFTLIHGDVAITKRQATDTSPAATDTSPAASEPEPQPGPEPEPDLWVAVQEIGWGYVEKERVLFTDFIEDHIDLLYPATTDSSTPIYRLEVKPPGADWTRVSKTELRTIGTRHELSAWVQPTIFTHPRPDDSVSVTYRIVHE